MFDSVTEKFPGMRFHFPRKTIELPALLGHLYWIIAEGYRAHIADVRIDFVHISLAFASFGSCLMLECSKLLLTLKEWTMREDRPTEIFSKIFFLDFENRQSFTMSHSAWPTNANTENWTYQIRDFVSNFDLKWRRKV